MKTNEITPTETYRARITLRRSNIGRSTGRFIPLLRNDGGWWEGAAEVRLPGDRIVWNPEVVHSRSINITEAEAKAAEAREREEKAEREAEREVRREAARREVREIAGGWQRTIRAVLGEDGCSDVEPRTEYLDGYGNEPTLVPMVAIVAPAAPMALLLTAAASELGNIPDEWDYELGRRSSATAIARAAAGLGFVPDELDRWPDRVELRGADQIEAVALALRSLTPRAHGNRLDEPGGTARRLGIDPTTFKAALLSAQRCGECGNENGTSHRAGCSRIAA